MFMGSGTTALVANQHGRRYMGCELNAEYVALAENRLSVPITANMFTSEGL
jgi:DNA modification methylase